MKKKTITVLFAIAATLLAAEIVFIGVMEFGRSAPEQALSTAPAQSQSTTAPAQATNPTETTMPTDTHVPTEAATVPTETEPQQQRYLLTFAGDCTLGSSPSGWYHPYGFVQVVGEDYDHPFRNAVQYFENDDFTIINLEGAITDTGTPANKLFVFRGPSSYINILTGSSVEAVTLANNHSADYGKEGLDNTKSTLEAGGVAYVEDYGSTIYTTESGLTICLYAAEGAGSGIDQKRVIADITELNKLDVDLIICAFHWGNEGKRTPNYLQENLGRAAIDAGADIIYGHHPHVLQKIEYYGDGVIYYSLGNFSFGGNTFPGDFDTALLQQEVIRDPDGTVRLGELIMIPFCVSSDPTVNDYKPTPYEEGTEAYDRVLSKLNGTFTGPDLNVDYSHLTDPEETVPEETTPAETDPAETDPAETDPAETTPVQTQPDQSGDTGGDTGGDAGGSIEGETPAPAPEPAPSPETGSEE